MMRWFIVCALVAHTLAAAFPNFGNFGNWKMPTQDDLPEVTIPDIDWPELPTIPEIPEIPDVNVRMPADAADVLQSWRNPFQNGGSNGGQQRQYGNSRGQGESRSHQSWSNGQWSRQTQYENSRRQGIGGQTGQGRGADAGRQEWQWQGSRSNGGQPGQYGNSRGHSDRGHQSWSNGQWSQPTQYENSRRQGTGRHIPTRYDPIQKTRRIPPQSQPQRQTQAIPRPPTKQRKQRPNPREGPPQRRAPVWMSPRGQPQDGPEDQQQTRPRVEPSMTQQVESFRTGMPRWLQDELSDTFISMEREINQGRLQMDSWSEDIRTAAQSWWDKWTSRRDTGSARRPSTPTQEETPRRQPPSTSWQDRWSRNRTSTRPNQHNPSSRGQSRYPSKGRKNKPSRNKWYNNTVCRRPFRPAFVRPTREEPEYKVLCGGDDYEARLYSPSAWVSVTVQALTYDLALHKAYMKLYRYIHGHNNNGSEVTRTVPVHTKVKSNAREYRWFRRHNYTISFYLPKDVHVNPPAPNDPQLFIEYEGATVYYAHTFRGYALEFNIWEYLDELTNTLQVSEEAYHGEDYVVNVYDALDSSLFNIWEYLDGLTNTLQLSEEAYLGEDYVVNVYDAPWRLFNRRNEILVAMDADLMDAPMCVVPEDRTTEALATTFTTTVAPTTTTVAPTTTFTTAEAPTTKLTTIETPTTKITTTKALPALPVEIELPPKNPFDNNDLEQESGGFDCVVGKECPRYEMAVRYDEGFQLRHYAYSRWICMDQAACDIERAQKLTQGTLLEYFYPQGNREQIPMEVTTPLVIGMDVSDLNNTDCGKVYTSCMFIPEEHQGAPPTPRDARLYLQDIPSMSRYVKPFGGYATSQNVPQRSVDFLGQLAETKLAHDGSIVAVAQYTTSKIAKTRLNELWVMDQSLLLQGDLELE